MDEQMLLEALGLEKGGGYWQERLLAQLAYLDQAMTCRDVSRRDFEAELDRLASSAEKTGALTKEMVLEAEARLGAVYGELVKSAQVIFAAHAHIDMNWEWGFDETVGVIIDTFQTMLDLMEEFPDFYFSQSQASTYAVIEQYCPSLLEPIRQRIAQGRWEVTASTWVEHDKNMAGTEAMLRQLICAKRYLSRLLGVDMDSLNLDFEPDTFGHSAYVPQVLRSAGVNYYYHCRGYDGKRAYRFRAPSGQEVLAYCEPNWYLGPVTYDMLSYVPAFCRQNGVDTAMVVYGVGDHGGGPTRRDIRRIRDMAAWPLLPRISMGRMGQFFQALEKARDRLPVVDRELNFVFTGCYTAQSRIKQANRYGEDRLHDSQALCAMAAQATGGELKLPQLEQAWRRILFNQFHDILPGSCVRESREYALGGAAEAYAQALANANRAMRAIGQRVDTSLLGVQDDPDSTAQGAGAGYGASKSSPHERLFSSSEYNVSAASRCGGPVRPYTLFNPTQYHRDELVEVTVWDWKYPARSLQVVDGEGQEVPHTLTQGETPYWQHTFLKVVFPASVPPYGYANYYLRYSPKPLALCQGSEPRVHRMESGLLVLENQHIRASFASHTMKLVSLIDLESGQELIPKERPGAYLWLAEESEVLPYNAWTIGNYGLIQDLNETCFVDVKEMRLEGLRPSIAYEMKFRHSWVRIRVSLDQGARMLRFAFEVDWNDKGISGYSTPQLRFAVPYAYPAETVRYDVPAGWVDRPLLGHDVPAILYAAPVNQTGGPGLLLTTDCKYGYRGVQGCIDLNLLRSSCVPDAYPEHGFHRFEVGLGVTHSFDWTRLRRQGVLFSHPIYAYANSAHPGPLPQKHSFIQVEGRSAVVSVEPQGEGLLLRLNGGDSQSVPLAVGLDAPIAQAQLRDALETTQAPANIAQGKAHLEMPPHGLMTVYVQGHGRSE